MNGRIGGASSSDPTADPNPLLEAYLPRKTWGNCRLLLDSFFDTGTPTSNTATCAQVNASSAEALKAPMYLANQLLLCPW